MEARASNRRWCVGVVPIADGVRARFPQPLMSEVPTVDGVRAKFPIFDGVRAMVH